MVNIFIDIQETKIQIFYILFFYYNQDQLNNFY